MSTDKMKQTCNELAWKLIRSPRGSLDIDTMIDIIGFYIALFKQYKFTVTYDSDLILNKVLELDNSTHISINDICHKIPSKDFVSYIIRLIKSEESINYAKLFETIISLYTSKESLRQGVFYQPKEVTNFVSEILGETTGKSIYNPFAGLASYQLVNSSAHFDSQEINRRTWILGKIILFLNDISDNSFVCENSVHEWRGDLRKYDIVVATPPIKRTIKSEDVDCRGLEFKHKLYNNYILEKSLNSINENGSVVLVISAGLFFNNSDLKYKKYLVENGFIHTIVFLPNKIFYGTSISFVVIKLTHKRNDNILMVDGSSFFKKEQRKNILQYRELLVSINDLNSTNIKIVANKEIANNDFNLIPKFYVDNPLKNINIPKDFKLCKLKSLVKSYKNCKKSTSQARLIKGQDLITNRFSFEKTFKELKPESISKRYTLLNKDLLLIMKIGNLKPTLFHHSAEFEVYCSPNILAFEVNENIISPQYLVNEFSKEYISKQITMQSSGMIIPFISERYLLEIEILVPQTLDTQKVLFENDKYNYSLSKAKEYGLEKLLQKQKNDYLEEIRIKKHNLAQYLAELNSSVSVLSKYVNSKGLGSEVISKKSNTTLSSHISRLSFSIDAMNRKLELLTKSSNFGEAENVDINKFLKRIKSTVMCNFEAPFLGNVKTPQFGQ